MILVLYCTLVKLNELCDTGNILLLACKTHNVPYANLNLLYDT